MTKNFQRQSCSTINYLSNGRPINILAGNDPVPVKDARFAFHTRRTVQWAIADLLVQIAVEKMRCLVHHLHSTYSMTC